MTTNQILNAISNAGICDVDTLRKVLADGSARKYRNLGEKTYLEMCKLYFVEPFVAPKTPEEIERSQKMRRWKLLARRKMTPAKKVKKLEKQIEKLKAQLNQPNKELELCRSGSATAKQSLEAIG